MGQRDKATEATRLKLVAVAMGLFAMRGYRGVGIRDIAENAGTSIGALFHKWSGKEALFEDVMGRDWPDPAAFARYVLAARTLEEAHAGAEVYLGDLVGEARDGPVYNPQPRRTR
jgi:AcrR family transcriptional regulator